MFAKPFTEGLCLRCSDVWMLCLGVCIGAHTLSCPRVQWWRSAYFSLVGNWGRHIIGKRQLSYFLPEQGPCHPRSTKPSLCTSPRTEDLKLSGCFHCLNGTFFVTLMHQNSWLLWGKTTESIIDVIGELE